MTDQAARILVVDDELGIREGCRRILAAEGYEVETAEDGARALELRDAGKGYAAALVDLKMPGMDGCELIERLHAEDEDLVLFVITAYASIESAVDATKRGAYGYIPKPFTPDELLLRVRNGLAWRQLAQEARRLREERESRLLEVAFERSKSLTIINCMADGVLVANSEGQLVLRNDAAARMLPSCLDAHMPEPLDSAMQCQELKDLIRRVMNPDTGPKIATCELPVGKATYMVNASPVLDSDGRALGAVAILRDITPLKTVEAAKSAFVAMVAHEVKRPLAAIEGYLQVVLSGAAGQDPKRDREMLDRSLVRARTLRQMVSELMDLTAIEAGKFQLERRALELYPLVQEAVEAGREKAKEKGIELAADIEASAAGTEVLGDREALLAILANLIDNAVKYTPESGHVSVQMRRSGQYASVSVQDDGIGMAPEEAGRAFEEFFRASNEHTARVAGTGLGLSIVKRLVELHQGRVSVQSKAGQGSTFTVDLPLAR